MNCAVWADAAEEEEEEESSIFKTGVDEKDEQCPHQ